jgi:hypothetical protein
MLVKLRSGGGPTETTRDALDEMLGCHERIRRFSRLAGALAAAPASDVVEAALAVHRYFSLALPLHAADEDHSFAPRLVATDPPPDVRAALEEMIDEHIRIEAELAENVPLWSELGHHPDRQGRLAVALDEGAARLIALFDLHLEKEERLLFPAARRSFTPEMIASLGEEMKARRA